MARLSKQYAPKGIFAPERLPPPPAPEPEPEPQPAPVFAAPAAPVAAAMRATDPLAGVDAGALRATMADTLWPHGARRSGGDAGASAGRLVVPVRGDGVRVWDTEGREYLDGFAGHFGANVGHGRGEIAAAMAAQLGYLSFASSAMPNIPAALLAARLARLAAEMFGDGGEGSRVFFTSDGAEAVEVALKIARASQRRRGFAGRYKIIGRTHAHHGDTAGALAVSGQAERKNLFEPLVPGALHVPPPHPARCPFCADREGCTYACADAIRRVAEDEGPGSVAAVIVEAVQSGGGCFVPPPGYFERVRATCDAHGILLVTDETTTGFGRVGAMFGGELFEVRPDIVAVGGGLTGGYAPLGAAIVSREVADAVLGGGGDAFPHDSPLGGHPVAAAAALATLDILEREELPGRSRDMGAYLLRELETALRDHPLAGEIRGMGLFAAVELVRDRDSRAPLDDPALLDAFTDETRRRGLICGLDRRPAPAIRLAPPLTIEREDVDRMVQIVAESLDVLRGRVSDAASADGNEATGGGGL